MSTDETSDEARVSVPRKDLEHILDWHNKRPCGVGQENYDLRLFKRLAEAVVLSPERDEQLRQEGRDEIITGVDAFLSQAAS